MAYGQAGGIGLVPYNNSSSAINNGQISRFYISPTYANNIFQGDLVYLGNDGFIHNLSDLQVATYPTAQALGVFVSCSFTQPTATNPVDPASPGRPYWPAGVITNGRPGLAFVITDPDMVYSITTDTTGISWADQSNNFSVSYTYVAGSVTNASGNVITGQSSLVLNSGSIGPNANKNLRVMGFDDTPGNPIPSSAVGGGPSPNVNVLVKISNHTDRLMAVGV